MNTLEDYVLSIKDLPQLVLDTYHQKYQIVFESSQEKKLVKAHKKAYRWTGKWLEYYILNKLENLEELRFKKEANNYKFRAQKDKTILNLVQEVFVHKELDPLWRNHIDFWFHENPGYWWYCIMWENCVFVLKEVGLLDTFIPHPLMGLQTYIKSATTLFNTLEDSNNTQIKHIDFNSLTAYSILFHISGLLAKIDIEFRNDCYYLWLSKNKRYINHIKRTPELKGLVLLSNGDLETLRVKHRKLPQH